MKDALSESATILEKGITTSDISETANGTTLRPPLDLVPFITDVSVRPTPFVDMFMPRAKRGIGKAHVFNKQLAKSTSTENPRDAVYSDGALPEDKTTSYSQVSVAFKSLGYSGSVTGLAQAEGGSFLDLLNREVNNKMALLKEALEWLSFYGSTTTNSPTTGLPQFPGLDELITNEVDAGGARLSGTTGKLIVDEAANLIGQKGGIATHMFTSFRTAQNINNTYNNNQSLQVIKTGGDDTNITWGEIVPKINTSVGQWKVIGDFFLNPGNSFTLPNGSQSTPSGATTSTAFVISENFINFVNLQPMVLEMLGKRTDKEEFFVKIYTMLEVLATEFMCKITNIDDTLS
jgi:hypothetical protein